MRTNRAVAWMALPAVLIAFFVWRLALSDHGQCDRRCAAVFGEGSAGSRSWSSPSTCSCDKGTIPRSNPGGGRQPTGTIVCGANGVTHPDAASAGATPVLHAGACGACSNAADIEDYRRTATTLTGIATRCAFLNTLFGEGAGRTCMERDSGLSPKCVDCWVRNMSCTAAHCLGVCLQSRMAGEPRNKPDGRLNDCLACDEAYCGDPFIRCAGANRRRAGIVSDIGRPPTQVWTH